MAFPQIATKKCLIDVAEARRALNILVEPGQVAELRILNATTQSSPRYPYTASGYFNDVEALTKELATIRTALGIYITLQPCKHELLSRAQNRLRSADEMKKGATTDDKSILQYRWLLIDCDPERPTGISSSNLEHEQALARAREIQRVLRRLGWPEPIQADSGNGAHLLYRIDLAVTDASLVSRVLIGLAGMFDIDGLHLDLKVFNPSRIGKLYGTLACKGDDTNERPYRMSRILEAPNRLEIVPRGMLEAMAAPEHPKKISSPAQAFDIERFIQEHHLDVNGPKPWNNGDKWVFNICPWNAEHTDRSAYILRFSSGAIAAGCQHNGCRGLGWKDLRTKYEPAKEKKAQSNQLYQDATERLKKMLSGDDPDEQPSATNGHKSELPVVVVGGQLRDTTRAALKAMAQAESKKHTIFVQTGRYTLVRVCKDKEGRPVLTPMGVPEIKHAMTHSANYVTIKINKTSGEEERLSVSPPKEVAEQILSLPPGDWPFPLLEAIVEIPQIRPNGSILSIPGYDETTKLYYAPQKELVIPTIPTHPTKSDIELAVEYIRGFLGDFPWVSTEADLANAFGLWLTTVIRQMVRHVPMSLINATAPGTGKGLLTDGTALLATGKTAVSLSPVATDEEWDKRITALLMAGATMISIDNVEGMLRSPILSKALTMDYHNGRVLGLSKMVDVPQRAIWIANGNNIQLGGDMPRRCFPINMALQVSDPWTRENFKYPHLIKAIAENRGKIIAALLTMTRGWFVAGQPAPRKKLGKLATFSEWVELVGGILSYAGIDGFLENLTEMHQKADIESKAWTLFLETWLEKLGKDEYTTKELIEKWNTDSKLADTLPDPIATWFQDEAKTIKNKVGKLLAKKEGRPYGKNNLRIVKGENTDAKVATFKVTGYTGDTGDNLSLHSHKKIVSSLTTNRENIQNGDGTAQTTDTPYPPYITGSNESARSFYDSFCSHPGHHLRLRKDGTIGIGVPGIMSDEEFERIKQTVSRYETELCAILKVSAVQS